MKTIARHALVSILLLAAISGAIFFRLGSLPLSGPDEPRYARVAEEMHEQGRWITPTLQGKPWLEKPPLYYWTTIPFLSFFHETETAARMAPALCAVLAALAVYWLGSILRTRLAGLLAGSILLTSLGFVGFGRSASTDMPFTCCFTLAMAILAAALKKNLGVATIACGYVFLGLAVLGKGPVAIILAAGIGTCFWLLDERGIALRKWRILIGTIVTAAISLPWFWLAFRQNGYSFISTFFLNHNLARYVTGIHHHSQPFYFFVPVIIALLFPWSGWLVLLIKSPIKEIRRWREWDPGMIFLHCWAIFPIIFFSFSDSKLAGYILPSLPPVALIMGMRFSNFLDDNLVKTRQMKIGSYLSAAFSLAIAIAAPIYFQKEFGNYKIGLLIGAIILIASLIGLAFNQWSKKNRLFEACALQGLLAVVITVQLAFPIIGTYHSAREIGLKALEVQRKGEPIVTYGYFHHSLNFYTGYTIAGDIYDPGTIYRFAQPYPSSLVVTTIDGPKTLLGIPDFSFTLLGRQGDLRLYRMTKTN
jgi:4-amino-4-deoxy-L-arabinose transferase-like glycosyltransferase